MSAPRPWSPAEGRLLLGLLNLLVPASADGRIPAAGTHGVADFLARKAAADPGLATLFCRSLALADSIAHSRGASFDALDAAGRLAVVETLEREAPDAFAALLRHAYMGYYSRADIRGLLGLSARPTQPDGYAVPEDDPDELAELLAPVRKRGSCFRQS